VRTDINALIDRFTGESLKGWGADLAGVCLVGSAARGDFVEGFSDLDFVIILRSDDDGLRRRILLETRELKSLLEREHGIRFGVNYFSRSELFSPARYPRVNPLAMHEFVSSSRSLWGRGLDEAALPKFESTAIRRFAAADVLRARSILVDSIAHLRPSDEASLKLAIRQSIWCTYRAAKAYLAAEGDLVTGRDATQERLEQVAPQLKLGYVPRRLSEIRNCWEEVRGHKALLIEGLRDSISFMDGLADRVRAVLN